MNQNYLKLVHWSRYLAHNRHLLNPGQLILPVGTFRSLARDPGFSYSLWSSYLNFSIFHG